MVKLIILKIDELIEQFEKLDFLPVIREEPTTENCRNNLLMIFEITSHMKENKIKTEKISKLIENLIVILSDKDEKVNYY